MQVLRIDPGFNPDNLLTFQVEVLDKKYANVQQRLAFFDRALERFRQLPGVNFVGMCESRPPDFLQTHREFMVEGQVTEGAGQNPTAHLLPINSDFFSAMGVKLISGRAFTDADRDGAPKAAIINQHLADRVMPDENPIGKRIRPGGKDSKEEWHTVVGVVGDVDYTGVDDDPGYQVYFSYLQHPTSGTFFMIRTAGDPANMIGAARREIASIDSERPIARIKTGQELISDAIAEPRFNTFLLSIFASVALILAITGIYGVISYSVSQRTHEIGIRMALGAKRGDIIRQVLWSAARLVLIGVGLGLGAAFALTRTMQTLLFDVAVTDKTTYIVAAVILTLVAVLACLIPARRASRVDPMIALRYE
jgi:putative ABC transport system permease protein